MPPGYEGERKERSNRGSDDDLANFNRNVGKVVETLRRDYDGRMFIEELDFDIYTEDLQLVDPVRGAGEEGGWVGDIVMKFMVVSPCERYGCVWMCVGVWSGVSVHCFRC